MEWVGACTDVEDERRAADHLRQTQRIEAVGNLAGGVAHEVNNMMTAVIGFGGFVLKGMPEDHPQRSDVSEMVKAATRAAGITRQLLAFTRQQVLQPSVLDLNSVITDLGRMLTGFLGADIELNVHLDPQTGRVRADRGQLEQVIINLALNARYAMKSGGRLTLETTRVTLDEGYARRHVGHGDRAGPVRRPECHRHRRGNGRCHPGPGVRAVLHHQAGGRGNRARSLHRLRNRQAVGRVHLALQ